MFGFGTLWPLEPKPLTWGQIWDHISDWPFRCASSRFCRLSLSIMVWAAERLNWNPALLNGTCENFAMMTSFYLENIDLGSQNLHLTEFLYEPTYPPNFVFLALTGAVIAVGGRFCPPPPSRARNSQTLSRERVRWDSPFKWTLCLGHWPY